MSEKEKMFFIQNIESLKDKDGDISTIEYEVVADANIVGILDYGPYVFRLWEFSGYKRDGEERKLNLLIKEKIDSSDNRLKSASRSGFYHGGGIADELSAIASLLFRKRFKVGPIVRLDDQPLVIEFKAPDKWIDRHIVAGESNLSELDSFLEKVSRLDVSYHQKYILAVRLYHQALQVIEEQPDTAYLNLVSAIEVLCQETKIEEPKLIDLDKKLADIVHCIEDESLRNEIEKAILSRERFISRRFVRFILDHIEENFWTKTKRPKYGRVKPEELNKFLNKIYEQRSKTLHEGEPFPKYIFLSPLMGEEVPTGLSVMMGKKKWDKKDFIPYPHFFERLVNHVMITFLERNQL